MTLRKTFLEKSQEVQEIDASKWKLHSRIKQAQKDIENLEQEKTELKSKRPMMLADNEDITGLSSRLKEIDDEIEICKETILGVNEKLESMKNPLRNAKVDADNAFEEMVKAEMEKLVPAYQKYAKKLADVILDYNALEAIYNDSRSYYQPAIKSQLEVIPNLLNKSEPFLKHYDWGITREIQKNVREKYNLTDFQTGTQ